MESFYSLCPRQQVFTHKMFPLFFNTSSCYLDLLEHHFIKGGGVTYAVYIIITAQLL